MTKKAPLCQIFKPAPWQKSKSRTKPAGPNDTHPWGREQTKVQKPWSKEEIRALFWDRENTPSSDTPLRIAKAIREEDE